MTVEEILASVRNQCLHCHTYNSWLAHQHYKKKQYRLGGMFHYMADFYWRLAQ